MTREFWTRQREFWTRMREFWARLRPVLDQDACLSPDCETSAKNRPRVLDQAAPSFGPGCASFGPGCASFGPGCASFGPGCAQFWTRMRAYLQNVKHSPKTCPESWTRLRPVLDQDARVLDQAARVLDQDARVLDQAAPSFGPGCVPISRM